MVKVNKIAQQDELGYTSKSPRWAIAYKFKAESTYANLESVQFQVGRTGAITPVAILNPVVLGGTVVKRASLHNADQIENLTCTMGTLLQLRRVERSFKNYICRKCETWRRCKKGTLHHTLP